MIDAATRGPATCRRIAVTIYARKEPLVPGPSDFLGVELRSRSLRISLQAPSRGVLNLDAEFHRHARSGISRHSSQQAAQLSDHVRHCMGGGIVAGACGPGRGISQ